MQKSLIMCFVCILYFMTSLYAADSFEQDTIRTSNGDLVISFLGHATLMLSWRGKIIHIDPIEQKGDYSRLPKADLVLITHEHFDHLDVKSLKKLKKNDTKIILTQACTQKVKKAIVMNNGDVKTVKGIKIEAVPAYNIIHKRKNGQPFHPKGVGNGYVLTFGDKRVYIAGDTENVPEMKNLQNIDIAFLPMNLPYTMTPEMVAKAALMFQPKILYPYHYGDTNPQLLVDLLQNQKDIKVLIRSME